ncbi:hypothetical protein [Mesorhizobium sp. CA12]|uniref:hypothetical protein n=1 Tax=Mesorhizobium sp. CA12 TaxID=2876644 RepID=UPI001CCF097D|nr:hypothetical protein [Mesorhizobium sp. CA12]MBZ9862170.1 hypothetical protein [Mesorhizobium sp. CA12]
MADESGSYSISIDGRWSLEDLYKFPRAYEQVYFAMEAVLPSEIPGEEQRIFRAFRAYPWRGGYSAVNFYNQLKYATPPHRRPTVASIRYSSPGWIELIVNQPLAYHVGVIIMAVAGGIKYCNSVYHRIYTDMQNRQLLRMEVELKRVSVTAEELKIVAESADEMARLVGLPSADALHARTGDPLISLKILFSIFRRVRLLAEYKDNGKADFPRLPGDDNKGDLF